MKKLLALILALGIVPIATGQITLEVREADGETPFDCNDDIMVGSKATIIVSSDCNDYWPAFLEFLFYNMLLIVESNKKHTTPTGIIKKPYNKKIIAEFSILTISLKLAAKARPAGSELLCRPVRPLSLLFGAQRAAAS